MREVEFPLVFDPSSRYGSLLLADHVMAYWARKGYKVLAKRVQFSETVWGVRSNLVAGLPPARRDRTR